MTVYIKLIFGILVLSWSSILIRWMGDIHPLIITFYRLAFSCLIILILIKKPVKSIKNASIKHYKYLITAGLFLSMHFYTWITSLQLTTVGNSIFLESTHPLFGWILSIIILREKISKIFIPSNYNFDNLCSVLENFRYVINNSNILLQRHSVFLR